jgi:excinuclease ABC subunit A
MEPRTISISGAREHNLKNVSLTLPRNKLICFTGVSGSGKSSLAFDTLFAEGQRRYLESLSSYARQFLDQLAKPQVDRITGLSPAISIQQKTSGWNPRSTVGTVTQIHDYLRVLFARVGRQHCPKCGQAIKAQTRDQIISRVLELPEGSKALVLGPVVRGQKGEYRDLFEDMMRQGYARARVDGRVVELRDPPALARNLRHNIEIVVDRLTISPGIRARVSEAVELALKLGDGTVIVQTLDQHTAAAPASEVPNRRSGESSPHTPRDLLLSSHYACATCDLSFEPPSPQLFSFNSPTGMCLRCDGMGTTFDFDPDLLVPDGSKSLLQHAVQPMRIHMRVRRWRRHIYQGVADHMGFDLKTPWAELPDKAKRALLHGLGDTHVSFVYRSHGGRVTRHGGTFAGILAELRERHRKTQSSFMRAFYEQYMRQTVCPVCTGGRLNGQALAVRVGGKSLREVSSMSIQEAQIFFDELSVQDTASTRLAESAHNRAEVGEGGATARGPESRPGVGPGEAEERMPPRGTSTTNARAFTPTEQRIAADVLKEIRGRLSFLSDVGLDYLSLDRTAPTLSGGESQRIRLASQIGAGLTGVLYILDEPSIGLHPRDNQRLLDSLKRLRDLGNTVIVVEHDEQTMREADEIVDFGPGPGIRGGEVVAQGDLRAIALSKNSLTARYLRGDEEIPLPPARRFVHPHADAPDRRTGRAGAKRRVKKQSK